MLCKQIQRRINKIAVKYIELIAERTYNSLQSIYSIYQVHDITVQKMKIFIRLSSVNVTKSADQIRRKLLVWSHLLKKSLMEQFIFYAVHFALQGWINLFWH